MPDLLLELRSEEIPARMQRKAAGDLKKLVTDALVERGLTYEGAREYWTPRRLTLDIRGLNARSADVREEKKGPRTDANEKAIEGFLRGAGLNDISEAQVVSDPKKGDFYIAIINKPGRPAEEIIAEVMPGIIRSFPWPKSMRSGPASMPKGSSYAGIEGKGSESLRWVRPLQSIVCLFGPEHDETQVIPFVIDGIVAGNVTYGHRFHAPGPITVRRFEDYVSSLEKAKVVLDAERRKDIILHDARDPKQVASYLAERAQIIKQRGDEFLRMQNGHIVRRSDGQKAPQIITFTDYAIGVAFSADGTTFTRAASNGGKVLDAAQVYPASLDGVVADPELVVKDGVYHLWFSSFGCSGTNCATVDRYGIAHATSTDAITWTVEAAPVMSLTWAERSRTRPSASIRPGRSPPGGPNRKSFIPDVPFLA